jgi:hypothetical protein
VLSCRRFWRKTGIRAKPGSNGLDAGRFLTRNDGGHTIFEVGRDDGDHILDEGRARRWATFGDYAHASDHHAMPGASGGFVFDIEPGSLATQAGSCSQPVLRRG